MNLENYLSEIQKRAAEKPALGNTIKFNIGGTNLFIDGNNGNAVSMEDKDADCTISMSQEDFIALVTKQLNPMMAMMSGKIKLSGDMGVAMKLQGLL